MLSNMSDPRSHSNMAWKCPRVHVMGLAAHSLFYFVTTLLLSPSHTFIRVDIHMRTCIHAYIDTCKHGACILACMHTGIHKHVYMNECMSTFMVLHPCIPVVCMKTIISTCTHAFVRAYMYTCLQTCMHVDMHVYICIHVIFM